MTVAPIKLPFGIKDGELVHVTEVPSGKACGCTCPGCGGQLVAKRGRRVVHHFAHASDVECAHGVETALHLAAKRAIEGAGYFVIPSVFLDFGSYKTPWLLAAGQRIEPDEVVLEHRLGGVVPDVILNVRGTPLLVEVAVTHFVDEAKRQRLVNLGMSTVEVSLAHLERDASAAAIAAAVVDGVQHKRWIYNRQLERERSRVFATADARPVVRRGGAAHADGCPIPAREWRGKAYANVIDDCAYCEFCVDTGLDGSDDELVFCLGRRRISSVEDWKRVQAEAQSARGAT